MTDGIRIAFLGAGNMGSSLITGLLQQGYPPALLSASNHNPSKLSVLATLGIHTTANNLALLDSDLLVLCLKPQHLKAVAQSIGPNTKAKVVITIAAGITCTQLQVWLQRDIPICRAMPNTPARLGIGMTALYAPSPLEPAIKAAIESLFQAVGEKLWIEEETHMDIVTALSGSGPAYIFYLLEAMIHGATLLGLNEQTATQLTLKTVYGAAVMGLASPDALNTLRAQVTSKGGTTESGLAVLEQHDLFGLITKTLQAATERGKTLSSFYSDSEAKKS